MGSGGEPAKETTGKIQATPLREVGTFSASKSGYLAWVEPVVGDDKGNAYFLLVPVIPRQSDLAGDIPRPRDVLRLSADGKRKSTLSPVVSSKFANAKVTTAAIALDPDGSLSMLIWARWDDSSGHKEKTGQYIVSLDKAGKYRTELEVNSRELGVTQFEAFGSGQFLLRGWEPITGESRLAILSANGQVQDVVAWSDPTNALDPSAPPPATKRTTFNQMVRSGDGRIYVTQQGERSGENVVFAISASGQSERLFTLPRLPGEPPLRGLKAAGDRLAAVYLETQETVSGGPKQRWWVAIYSNAASEGDLPLAVYGPAPGAPISYRQEDSGDRFTFLRQGQLVTMSSR
jgi:hypothetical protein